MPKIIHFKCLQARFLRWIRVSAEPKSESLNSKHFISMQTDPEMPLMEVTLCSGTLYRSIFDGLFLKKCPLKWLNWSNMEL